MLVYFLVHHLLTDLLSCFRPYMSFSCSLILILIESVFLSSSVTANEIKAQMSSGKVVISLSPQIAEAFVLQEDCILVSF